MRQARPTAPLPHTLLCRLSVRHGHSSRARIGRRRSKLTPSATPGSSLPTLEELRWRLDVSISTSALHRVLRPQLTLQCELSNGSVRKFHVSKQRFNELRFVVAKCLKDMQDVEARLPVVA